MPEFNRILLIQTAFLGDAILTTPLIRAVKELYPSADLDVLIIPQSQLIFKHNPHIHKILLFDKRKSVKRILSFYQLLRQIKNTKYDLGISAQLAYSSSLLMYLGGIPNRLGFPRQKLTSMTIDLPKGIPVVKRYLKLMEALTDRRYSHQTELIWDDKTQTETSAIIGDYLISNSKVIAIAPGSVWATKRWLPEYFAQLIKLLDEYQIKAVLFGGREDLDLCNSIAAMSKVKPLNFAGKLSLLGSAALIKQLPLLISNDSAPLHIANAVQTDVIAIFGPTVTSFGFAPFRVNDRVLEVDLPCRPCGKHGSNRCPLKHFHCMNRLTPDIVLKSTLEVLEHS